ncbi:hypothetical protein EG327_005998 [Venturia inaequalis]|uniref:Uncharacterized protein n=1 Tax=Venturia inaequalis TaxID=5025 RepID=A0A8H3VMV5_VENIN|nr:hypothetical protein EG327_005998 [Venturia inaequalis]
MAPLLNSRKLLMLMLVLILAYCWRWHSPTAGTGNWTTAGSMCFQNRLWLLKIMKWDYFFITLKHLAKIPAI